MPSIDTQHQYLTGFPIDNIEYRPSAVPTLENEKPPIVLAEDEVALEKDMPAGMSDLHVLQTTCLSDPINPLANRGSRKTPYDVEPGIGRIDPDAVLNIDWACDLVDFGLPVRQLRDVHVSVDALVPVGTRIAPSPGLVIGFQADPIVVQRA